MQLTKPAKGIHRLGMTTEANGKQRIRPLVERLDLRSITLSRPFQVEGY
jgi:hypothetical protein